jgi:Papain-like cysteine protease AvrRpt2
MAVINIQHRVNLFAQPTENSCWSAATTMLYGDRSIGPGSANLENNGQLQDSAANIATFASTHGLRLHDMYGGLITLNEVIDLLRRGPFMALGRYPTSKHAYVISGIYSEGSINNSYITVCNPYPPGRGVRSRIGFAYFLTRYPLAALYILQR